MAKQFQLRETCAPHHVSTLGYRFSQDCRRGFPHMASARCEGKIEPPEAADRAVCQDDERAKKANTLGVRGALPPGARPPDQCDKVEL